MIEREEERTLSDRQMLLCRKNSSLADNADDSKRNYYLIELNIPNAL